MTTFYLIGPSGVGKSTVGLRLSQAGTVRLREASAEARGKSGAAWHKTPHGDWRIIEPILDDMEAHRGDKPLVVVLGAGTQRYGQLADRALFHWLESRSDRLILLKADHQTAFAHYDFRATRRRRGKGARTLDQHVRVEFDPLRQELYDLAGLVVEIDPEDNPDTTASKVLDVIQEYQR